MCKCRVSGSEVPIHFARARPAQSKLTLKQQFKYLEHLSRLYDFTFPRCLADGEVPDRAGGEPAGGAALLALRAAGAGPIAACTLGYAAGLLLTALFHLRDAQCSAILGAPQSVG